MGDIPTELVDTLMVEEGYTDYIYLDTGGKYKRPTTGMGHLLANEELEKYNITGWAWKAIPNIGKRQVAVTKSDDGKESFVRIDDSVLKKWASEDTIESYKQAKNDAKQLNITDKDFINRLTHVNYQQGADWHWEGRFPGVFKALKDRDWQEAIENVEWVNPDTKSDTSDWYSGTPTRAKNFMKAIESLGNRMDRASIIPDEDFIGPPAP